MRARILGPSVAGSIPRMRKVPPLTGETAATIRIVEDLPAPLGPRKPNASPRRTSTSMPRTASTTVPSRDVNDLRSPDASIITSVTAPTLVRPADRPLPHFRSAGTFRLPNHDWRSTDVRDCPLGDVGVVREDGAVAQLQGFSASTRTWFEAAFATPTPAQVGAWEAISAGRHALVVAP